MLKSSHLQPVLTCLASRDNWNVGMAKNRLDQIYGGEENWPIILNEIHHSSELSPELIDIHFSAIGGLVNYFRQLLIEGIFKTSKIKKYDPCKFYKSHMILDA